MKVLERQNVGRASRSCAGVLPDFDWRGFLSLSNGRVLSGPKLPSCVRAAIDGCPSVISDNGFRVVTSCERPDLLAQGQFLFWPSSEPLPNVKQKAHVALPPHVETRRRAPDRALREDELANAVFEGDCLAVLPRFPARSIDLVLCDLPYGTTQNSWDSQIPLDLLWEQYRRVLKPNGAVVLTSQGVFTAKLILSNPEWFKYKYVWVKSKATNFLNAKKQPLRKHEDVCVFYARQPVYHPEMTRGDPYDKGIRKNQLTGSYGDFQPVRVQSDGVRYPTDLVYFKTAESEGDVWHPTQKPVELGRYLIRTFTDPGALVLDNAFGSGSFLVAAAKEGRRYVGIEKNEEVRLFKNRRIDYIDVALSRLSRARRGDS